MELLTPEQLRSRMGGERERNTGDVLLYIAIVLLFIVVILRAFVFSAILVEGDSMLPNLHTGDYLLGDRVAAKLGRYDYGDIVVVDVDDNPATDSKKIIKRVVGMPGDLIEIKDGRLYRNGEPVDESAYGPKGETKYNYGEFSVTVADDEVFVLGDNRENSNDSRYGYPHIKRISDGKGGPAVVFVVHEWSLRMKGFYTSLYNFRDKLSGAFPGCGR